MIRVTQWYGRQSPNEPLSGDWAPAREKGHQEEKGKTGKERKKKRKNPGLYASGLSFATVRTERGELPCIHRRQGVPLDCRAERFISRPRLRGKPKVQTSKSLGKGGGVQGGGPRRRGVFNVVGPNVVIKQLYGE